MRNTSSNRQSFSNTPGASGSAGGFSRFGAPGQPIHIHANGGGGGADAESANAPGGGSAGGRTSSSRDAGELSTAPPTSPSSQDATLREVEVIKTIVDYQMLDLEEVVVAEVVPWTWWKYYFIYERGISWRWSWWNWTSRPRVCCTIIPTAIPGGNWSSFNTAVGPTGFMVEEVEEVDILQVLPL